MNPVKSFTAAWRRPGCAVLAVLAGCLLCGTAAGARADLAARTHALQTTIDQTPVTQRTVNAVTDYPMFTTRSSDPAAAVTAETGQIYSVLAPTLPVQPSAQAWADLVGPPVSLEDAPKSAIASPGTPPEVTIDFRQNLSVHARLVAGHWPDTAATSADGAMKLEIAVTQSTLARYSAHVGSVLSLGGSVQLVVAGVIAPTDPAGAFWQSRTTLAAPILDTPIVTPPFWNTAVFVGSGEINALPQIFDVVDLELSWTVPLIATGYTPAELPSLAYQLTSSFGTDALTLAGDYGAGDGSGIGLTSDFTPTILRFINEQSAEEIETAMPTASLAMIGLIALVLLSRATVDRRERESTLLLARGAPLRELLGRATIDGAMMVLPATAVAIGVVLALPGTTSAGLWWRLILIPVAALSAPALFTVARHARTMYRRARPSGAAGSEGAGGPRRRAVARRVVAQAALAALCLAGLEQVRTNGLAPGGGIDVYTACAPLLAAALATLLTLNVGPVVLRLLLRVSRRRRGAIGLLGISRTARTPAPAAITVFILTLALSTADLALALHRAPTAAAKAAAASAGSKSAKALAAAAPDPLQGAAATYLAILAVVALAAGCLIVALAAGGDAAERRVATARLTVMGLTAGQARGVAVAELCAPIVLAAVGGTLAAVPLLWTVHPALTAALGGSGAQLTIGTLAAPVLTLVPLALAAGLAGAALARRGAAGALRLGDQAEGSLA